MKNVKLLTIAALLSGTSAYADGFRCSANDQALNVTVYNKVQPSEGTRNASVMILSNDDIQFGNKTIAVFREASGTLVNSGASYMADVDLRFSELSRKGELIAGTKLGQLQSIQLDVGFKYVPGVYVDDILDGTLTLTKRNGEEIALDVSCVRYLKGDAE